MVDSQSRFLGLLLDAVLQVKTNGVKSKSLSGVKAFAGCKRGLVRRSRPIPAAVWAAHLWPVSTSGSPTHISKTRPETETRKNPTWKRQLRTSSATPQRICLEPKETNLFAWPSSCSPFKAKPQPADINNLFMCSKAKSEVRRADTSTAVPHNNHDAASVTTGRLSYEARVKLRRSEQPLIQARRQLSARRAEAQTGERTEVKHLQWVAADAPLKTLSV